MLKLEGLKLAPEEKEAALHRRAARLLRIPEEDVLSVQVLRRSIDAREELHLVYTVAAEVRQEKQVPVSYTHLDVYKRQIYDNIRKAIQFLLASNMSEVLGVFVATLLGFTLMNPVHLLFINLITDCFPALALGLEKGEPDVMERPPRPSRCV